MDHEKIHKSHTKHRNILYGVVVILLILQITSFVVLSLQVTKLEISISKKDENFKKTSENLAANLEEYKIESQQSLNEISKVIADQQEKQTSFEQQIRLIKATQADFSTVIEEAVKGVVGITTDRSIGSGFIVNPEGFIITNYHVIIDTEEINVFTFDRKVIPAKLLAYDNVRDLALLKIDGNYNALKLGDSDEVEVGNKVIAIGNPLGLSFTVTEGIVSALERRGQNGLREYIQTDVSLNPGNSGGPLINTLGEVIGINNFKISDTEGLGFALESNAIRNSINGIMNQTIIK